MRDLGLHEIDFVGGAAGSSQGPVVLAAPVVSGPADGPQQGRFLGFDPEPMPTPAPGEI